MVEWACERYRIIVMANSVYDVDFSPFICHMTSRPEIFGLSNYRRAYTLAII